MKKKNKEQVIYQPTSLPSFVTFDSFYGLRLWPKTLSFERYRKIPKISPSMYKPLPGASTWKIALKYKVKQSKNSKFNSNYKASPIDFETQISLYR